MLKVWSHSRTVVRSYGRTVGRSDGRTVGRSDGRTVGRSYGPTVVRSMLYFWMRRLLAFYDHGKDKAKIRYDHSAFQEPASIGTGGLRCKRSESVKQYARIVWASLISSLEVARYDCLPHRFSPTFLTSSF